MKRLSALTSLYSLAFLLALISSSFAEAPSGPSIVLPERSFDFKEVEEGKTVEHSFKVLNKGNEVLEIRKVNPG